MAEPARTDPSEGNHRSEFLQDRYAPHSDWFGCGPANPQGLRVKRRVEGDRVVADWTPASHHKAFEGFLAPAKVDALLGAWVPQKG